jgi:hypothetical protein
MGRHFTPRVGHLEEFLEAAEVKDADDRRRRAS